MPFQERKELNGSQKKDEGEGKKIEKKKGEHKKTGGGARQGMLELWEYHHPVSSAEQSLQGSPHLPQRNGNSSSKDSKQLWPEIFLRRFKSWKKS